MKPLLVVLDPADNDYLAVARGQELARALGTSMHIVAFCYANLRFLNAESIKIQSQVIDNTSGALAKYLSTNVTDVEYTHETVWTKQLYQWVLEYVDNNFPVAVVKAIAREGSSFYAPTDWQLLRRCRAPLFLTTRERWVNEHNILVAVDLETKNQEKQDLNHKLLHQAGELAAHFGGQVHVCYTLPVSTILVDLGLQSCDKIEMEAKTKLAPLVEEICEKYPVKAENVHLKAGEPEKVIPSIAADTNSEVLLIGTSGKKHQIQDAILGNTAEKVLHLLRTDVFAFKP